MSNIFINDISINYVKDKFYELLNLYCIKDNSNYILLNKEIYKKYEYNNKIKEFVDFIKNYYKKSKKYFVERIMDYNNFASILRHLCKLLVIPYYKKIVYNKNSYSIEYYIKKKCL